MSGRVSSHERETANISRALRRAAKRALELGLATGTPVWVMKKGKLVDLTKDQPASKKPQRTRSPSKKPPK